MVQRILEAGDIELLDHSAIPRIRTPERLAVFAARAARLRQLAALGNPIAGYLRLMAVLADAQQEKVYLQSFARSTTDSWAPTSTLRIERLSDWLARRDPAAIADSRT